MDLLSTLSTLIPVLTAIALLAYWLGRKFTEINEEFELINRRFAEIDKRFNRLESHLYSLQIPCSQFSGLKVF